MIGVELWPLETKGLTHSHLVGYNVTIKRGKNGLLPMKRKVQKCLLESY